MTRSRHNQSALGRWFATTDKLLLGLVMLLIGIGIIAVAAASPAAAHRYSGGSVRVDDLHYLKRQLLWVMLGVPLMLGVSMLPVRRAKHLALIGAGLFLALLFAVPFIGAEVNGATRWIALPGFQLQPSEFLKPLFIVATAWLLATRFEDPALPVLRLSFGLLAVVLILLVRQPDFGQAILLLGVWTAQAMLAGMSVSVVGLLLGGATAAMTAAYLLSTHVQMRIDHFVQGTGDTFQIDRAIDCFMAGGLFGAGPGEGQMKFRLPEAHTDYIFSVIGEEFGAIACALVALLYLAIVVRVAINLLDEEEPFVLLAAGGLVTQFGLQAMINMMVNIKLLPSKGMTLPFISHGGSSFLALAIGMGLLLALTRRNPYLKASPYAAGRAP